MKSAAAPGSPRLSAATSGFVLAAAVTALFNTALAWAKDAYTPLTNFMNSLTGHHWTTHGLADVVLFAGLGFIFMNTGLVKNMDPNLLIGVLIGAVAIAGLGLVLWYAFV
jgi:hypothetical protein